MKYILIYETTLRLQCHCTIEVTSLAQVRRQDSILRVLCLTWQLLNNKGPSHLSSLIMPHKPKWLLRSSDNSDLCVPKYRTSYGDRGFRHKVWSETSQLSHYLRINLKHICSGNLTFNRRIHISWLYHIGVICAL